LSRLSALTFQIRVKDINRHFSLLYSRDSILQLEIYITGDYMFVKEDRFEIYFDKHTQYSKPQLGSVSILEVATAYRF